MKTLGFVIALALAAAAQDKPPRVDQAKIDNAIDRGAAYLLKQGAGPHNAAGNMAGGEQAYDELILYTLVHAGVDPNDATYKALLDRAVTGPLLRTYRVALTAMALATIDKSKYQLRISDCAQFLADNQCANGQWGYGEETQLLKREKPPEDVATGPSGGAKSAATGSSTKPLKRIVVVAKRPGPAAGDNSNSQYAALGIRACFESGIEFESRIIKRAAEWWEICSGKGGGWGYSQNGAYTHGNLTILGDDPYGSMTAGGIASLSIYRWILRQDHTRDKWVTGGVKFLSSNLVFKKNPKHSDEKRWQYYWIYAIERAGMIFGTERFGSHEWYPEGVDFLLPAQKEDGRWQADGSHAIGDTCFAILFLRRATKGLPKVATGR